MLRGKGKGSRIETHVVRDVIIRFHFLARESKEPTSENIHRKSNNVEDDVQISKISYPEDG